ncbi:MAG: protein kinase [Planctomycetota bacterium]
MAIDPQPGPPERPGAGRPVRQRPPPPPPAAPVDPATDDADADGLDDVAAYPHTQLALSGTDLPPADFAPTLPARTRSVELTREVPRVVGMQRLRLLDELGRGGLGVVRAAFDDTLRREVAIKSLLRTGARNVAAFIDEAQITGQLEHPNIVPVHELGFDQAGAPYLTMKRIRGRDLHVVIRETMAELARRPGDPWITRGRRLLEIFVKVCDAVAYAHSRGVIHRDLKPANVMVGDFGEVLVVDWGLAKPIGGRERTIVTDRRSTGAQVTMDGSVFGTPAFMPPEQARGEMSSMDERADVFALGAILYNIVSGVPPYTSDDTLHVLDQVRRGRLASPSARAAHDVPAELEAVVIKAMAFARTDRYATVDDLRNDVDAYLGGRLLTAATYSTLHLVRRWASRHKGTVITATSAAVIMVALVIAFIIRLDRGRAEAQLQEQRANEQAREALEAKELAAEEARRARDAEESSATEAERARAAERDSKLQLANSFVAQGDALLNGNRVFEAESRYRDAFSLYTGLGEPTFRAELGLGHRISVAPPPLMEWDAASNANFSADGMLAATHGNGRFTLRNVLTGRVTRTIETPPVLGEVFAIAVSYDSRTLVCSVRDRADLWVWDIVSGRQTAVLSGHSAHARRILFTRDNQRCISAGNDGLAIVWDMASNAPLKVLRGHRGAINGISLTDDDHLLATGSADGTITVWNLDTYAPLRNWSARCGQVLALAFTHAGTVLVSGGGDQNLRLWDVATGAAMALYQGHTGWVCDVAVGPNDAFILSGSLDHQLLLFRMDNGEVIRRCIGHRGSVVRVAIAPTFNMLVSAGMDQKVMTWSVHFAANDRFQASLTTIWTADLSDDGRLLAIGDETGSVRVFDVATGNLLRELAAHPSQCRVVRFRPDSYTLFSAGLHGRVVLWNLLTGRAIRDFTPHTGSVLALTCSPDGNTLVTGGGNDGILRVHRIDTGEVLLSMNAGAAVTCAVVSPDGTQVLIGDNDNRLRIVDLANGTLVRELTRHANWVTSVDWVRHGSRELILSGGVDQIVRLHDAVSGAVLQNFTGHSGEVRDVTLDPTLRFAASTGDDGSLTLWDLDHGGEIRSYRGPTTRQLRQMALAATANGRFLATASQVGEVVLYDLTLSVQTSDWQPRLDAAAARLDSDPDDAGALRTIGEWYAFRRAAAPGAALLRRVRDLGGNLSWLALARCAWSARDIPGARQNLQLARNAREAPDDYLELCLASLNN